MEGSFVWILLFAGVTLTFLGVLLVASERELKTKRREVEALLSKLEGMSEGSAAPSNPPEADHAAELDELRATNRNLQNQIAELSDHLDQSRKALQELEANERANATDSVEFQQLREANSQANAQAQAEVASLQERLYESQARIRELEVAQQNLPNLEEVEQRHRQQTQSLEAQLAELEKKLSTTQEKLQELDMLHDRLAESEREQQGLREQKLRQEQEMSQWQAQVAEAEVQRQKLAALQTPFNALLSKQALLAEKQRELQADLESFATLVGKGSQTATAASTESLSSPSEARKEAVTEPNKTRRFGII